jgi:hypothetical protein
MGGIPDFSTSFTIWLMATVGGLGLFLLLSRPVRRSEGSPAVAGVSAQPPTPDRAPEGAPHQATRQPRGEAQMARWLRPSVQAARYAQPGRDLPEPDDLLYPDDE